MNATKAPKVQQSLSMVIIGLAEQNLVVAKTLYTDNKSKQRKSDEVVYPASEGLKPAMDLIKTNSLPVKTVVVGMGEIKLPEQYRLVGNVLPADSIEKARELAKEKYPAAFTTVADVRECNVIGSLDDNLVLSPVTTVSVPAECSKSPTVSAASSESNEVAAPKRGHGRPRKTPVATA